MHVTQPEAYRLPADSFNTFLAAIEPATGQVLPPWDTLTFARLIAGEWFTYKRAVPTVSHLRVCSRRHRNTRVSGVIIGAGTGETNCVCSLVPGTD